MPRRNRPSLSPARRNKVMSRRIKDKRYFLQGLQHRIRSRRTPVNATFEEVIPVAGGPFAFKHPIKANFHFGREGQAIPFWESNLVEAFTQRHGLNARSWEIQCGLAPRGRV